MYGYFPDAADQLQICRGCICIVLAEVMYQNDILSQLALSMDSLVM